MRIGWRKDRFARWTKVIRSKRFNEQAAHPAREPPAGIKLQGTVESFDQFVVLLRNTVSQMVYKHAISTVVPARNVRVGNGTGPDAGEDEHGDDEAAAAP